MSIFLTEDLEQSLPTMDNTQLVYFFFSYQDENRNTGVILLQSLICQIITKRPTLKNHLSPYIKPKNVQQPTLSLEHLWAIFKNLVKDRDLGTMLCVLDGLDESDKDAIQILLPRLVDLLSPTTSQLSSTNFRLIVVSRDIRGLENCARVKLDPDNNDSVNANIQRFISVRTEELSKALGSRNECEKEVRVSLLTRSEGTFLWVGFAMYVLLHLTTWTEVFEALRTLPSGLPAIYSRMLCQIPVVKRQLSAKILQWVAMALRPLKLLEIAAAIDLKPTSPSISLEHAMKDEITLCGSFLKVQDSEEVTLIHQSVRDFLLDGMQLNEPGLEVFKISPDESHFQLAQKCLGYLEQSDIQFWSPRRFEPVKPGEPPLLRYAMQHWPGHLKSCSELGIKLFDPTKSFFQKQSDKRRTWYSIFTDTLEDATIPCYSQPVSLLQLACILDIVSWVKIMVDKGEHLDNPSGQILSEYPMDERDD